VSAPRSRQRTRCLVLIFGAMLAQGCASRPAVAPAAQQTFDTPAAAGAALFDAAQKSDPTALLAVLGPDAKDLVSSGDAAEDQASRATFVEKYRQMHRVGLDADNRTTLFVGAENWPVPIPLVSTDAKWSFDTAAGKLAVLYRRVGRNEESAVRICRELVAAEREYFSRAHDGGPAHQYAQHFLSSPGRHNGLFWEGGNGETESPIGPLLAFATSEADAKAAGAGHVPFHGYYFHMLKSQGKSAPGGQKAYVVRDRMTKGFAFVAYPAEYRSSGVLTFVVGPDGVVRQKDLGADSVTLVRGMTAFDPDMTWTRVEGAPAPVKAGRGPSARSHAGTIRRSAPHRQP
jgi:hypothetical protein